MSLEDFTFCLRTLTLTDTREAAQDAQRLHRMEKRQSHMTMNAEKDRIAETERVNEWKRARVERGAVDVPEEPGNKNDEQMAVQHADAFGDDIMENQHEEKRKRDIQVNE